LFEIKVQITRSLSDLIFFLGNSTISLNVNLWVKKRGLFARMGENP